MTYKDTIALSWRNIRGNKLRSGITVAIIALGICALIWFLTALKAASYSLNSTFSTMGANAFSIRFKERKIRKINNKGSVLKLNNIKDQKSIYPMIDEFGYTKYETTDATFPDAGWDPTKGVSPDSKNYSVNVSQLKYLIEIRDYAEKNGVNLIIGTVPLLAQDLAYRGTIRQIADDLGVGFIQGNDAVGQGKYFQDEIHLNREGARLFSEYLAKNLTK